MKKILNVLCVAAAIVALASCAKDSLGFKVKGTEKTFTAGFDGTRTAINDKYKTTWVENDKITIYNDKGDDDAVSVAAEDAGKYTATFTTDIPDSDNYYAVYGGETYMDGDAIDVIISDSQTGAWADAQIAAAVAVEKEFSFKNLSSVIEFEIASDAVKSVTFTSTEGFVNDVFVTFSEKGEPQLETQGTADNIVVNTNKVAGKYYAAMFPSEASKLTIQLEYEAEVKEIVIDTPLKFSADTVLVLGELESHVSKTYKVVSKETFSAVTGNIDSEGAFSYKANKGGATTNPNIYNNGIRLYQGTPGGNLEITSNNGDKIKGVKITTTNTYSYTFIDLKEDGAPTNINDTITVRYSSTKAFTGLNATKVTLYNYGYNNSQRAEIYSISVTYEVDARTPQTLSFPQASYTVPLSGPFSAPTVSGAQTTVTYSSSDPTVATVNSTTGAVSLVGIGTAVITATAKETDTYKEGVASYELKVANLLSGIAGIKTALTTGGTTVSSFDALVEDMLVTYVKLDAYPFVAYVQDANGDAIHIFGNNATDVPLAVGDKISGLISGKGKVYNGTAEMTMLSIDASAIKTTGCAVAPEVVTLATLEANYADYEYHMIKVADATIATAFSGSTEGSISQSETTVAIKGGNKSTISTSQGTVADIICFPQYNNAAHQLCIWEQSQVTVKGGANAITMASTQEIPVGQTWTIGATCLAGTVSYEITEGSQYITLDNGVVTGVAAGTAKIKATSQTIAPYSASEAICTITVKAAGGTTYTKVTTAPTDWSGEYVIAAIVKENKVLAWTGIDAGQCHTDTLSVLNNTITESDLITVTVAKMDGGYSVKVNGGANDGKYISSSTSTSVSYSNVLKFNKTAFPVQIQLNSKGLVEIWQVVNDGKGNDGKKVYFLYNQNSGTSNERFRFYKEANYSNYLVPALFKK